MKFLNRKNWLTVIFMMTGLSVAIPAFSATYDDDAVEVEMEEPVRDGKPPLPSRSAKKFSRNAGRDSRDSNNNDRSSSRSGRDRFNKKKDRRGRRDSGRSQGPANERFGKTKGKVRFVLVDDPTKEKATDSKSTLGRKKISLGPSISESSFRNSKPADLGGKPRVTKTR